MICCCSSVIQSFLTLCNPMDCSKPGIPVLHCLLVFAQTHVRWVSDAIQPTHPLPPPSFAFHFSQHQGLSYWISFSHQMAKILELLLQYQSVQWIFRIDFLWNWLVWFLAIQGTLKSLLQDHNSKASILWSSAFFMVQLSHPYMTTGKTSSLWLYGPLPNFD